MMNIFLSTSIFIFIVSCSHQHISNWSSCRDTKHLQEERSKELKDLVYQDQKDRGAFSKLSFVEMVKLVKKNENQIRENDKKRRMRVGEIFGEGCFSSADDYYSAALIYQHGDVPDHYLQTFLWAKKAVELGDKKRSTSLVAMAIDRYLVQIGHKQLFATQANYSDPSNQDSCFCLEQTEKSFPDEQRNLYTSGSLSKAYEWVNSLNKDKKCSGVEVECSKILNLTPKGFIPGFW